eukprot:gene7760-9550_t
MAADWLQGPYVYALYESYGFSKLDIAILFISGFLSSMVFGVVVGPVADKYGRKLLAMVFGVLYAGSCLTKVVNDFNILLFGRVLGGISTSLLFSVFETWMVSEHNSRGFPPELMGSTFYYSTFLNSIVAIFSGLWASEAASRWGYVSPFLWALGLLLLCSALVMVMWNENYGNATASLETTIRQSYQYLRSDIGVIKLGMIQSLFEASMYTFVFMWTPTLLESEGSLLADTKEEGLPFGLIFATFMVCIMIGSSLFSLITLKSNQLLQYILLLSIFSMLIPYFFNNSNLIYLSFLIFEICCGLYFPCMGTLRSEYIPESVRASIMNYFRVPLNFLVVLILVNISKFPNSFVFFTCATMLAISLTLLYSFSKKKLHQLPNILEIK